MSNSLEATDASRAIGCDVDPNLFRLQAMEAATSRYGSPVRPIGLAAWALTAFMVALLLSVALFLVFGRYTRKETVGGVIQPAAGAARIIPTSAGVVTEVFVAEGDIVKAGAPIAQISADLVVRNGSEVPVALSGLVEAGAYRESEAMTDQARARAQTLERSLDDLLFRRKGLRQDAVHLAGAIEMQRDRVRLAEDTFKAGKALHDRQLFSTLQLRQREESVIAARQNLAAIEREIQRNSESLDRLGAEEGILRAQSAQSAAEVSMSRAQFDQRHAEHLADHGTVLVANKAGRVAALSARAGSPVQPGRPIAIVLPEGEGLQAELWAPSRAAGFLRQGDRVRLMYDAFPYQKFGVGKGTVISVAGAPTDPTDSNLPIETREAVYRVVVNIDAASVAGYGRSWQLTPGMRLSADLVLDDRSLWEWLFDPIIAARRRAQT